MSIYDNETKIYVDLSPTAAKEPQSYRLNKLSEIKAYFLNDLQIANSSGTQGVNAI